VQSQRHLQIVKESMGCQTSPGLEGHHVCGVAYVFWSPAGRLAADQTARRRAHYACIVFASNSTGRSTIALDGTLHHRGDEPQWRSARPFGLRYLALTSTPSAPLGEGGEGS
jgi:hypothetical protein